VNLSRLARAVLAVITAAGVVFLYAPLAIIAVLSFNKAKSFSWPPTGLTVHWWARAWHSSEARDALGYSVSIAIKATLLALVLGSLLAFAVHRFRFFGREVVSFLVVLPIALPGIVTGIALNSMFNRLGITLGPTTLIVAHATFCIVVVYNNVVARLRRLSGNLDEASADLGADGWQTFRYVTFPLVRSSLVAGAILAFALSFDEIVVTTFANGARLTLPQWIFNNLFRPNQLPVVNVLATTVILLSIIPVYVAQRMADGSTAGLAGR
jgi:putative spermidine/putrescine transport system permease protein